MEPIKAIYTKDDIRVLESMFFQSAQEMGIILNAIEIGLWQLYRESKDFRKLVKTAGHNADAIVRATVHEQLTKDETYETGKILKKIGELKYLFDRLTSLGIEVKPGTEDKAKKEAEMFDFLHHDGNLMAWRHALMCNIDPEDDIKLDSTLKMLAKHHTVPEHIVELLKSKAETI